MTPGSVARIVERRREAAFVDLTDRATHSHAAVRAIMPMSGRHRACTCTCLTARMDSESEQPLKRELLSWLDVQRRHVMEQVEAMPAAARRRSQVPSGWTARGLVRHLTLDVERVWFRAVMAGEDVDLPQGYEGWTAPEDQSDEDLLEQYARECRLATAAIDHLRLDAEPGWWFEGGGNAPYSSLREVILHVIVETATHAGHLDICRELVDRGQRLVLDEPTT